MVLSLWVPPPSNVQPSPSFVKVPSFLSEELPLPPLCALGRVLPLPHTGVGVEPRLATQIAPSS